MFSIKLKCVKCGQKPSMLLISSIQRLAYIRMCIPSGNASSIIINIGPLNQDVMFKYKYTTTNILLRFSAHVFSQP